MQAPDQYQVLLDHYAAILEKTNQQLGLWSNPYGIMIGILGLLIALIAIGVSIALYRSSSEQKKRFSEWLGEQEKIAKEAREEAKKALGELIKEYESKLTSATNEQKEKIEKQIESLKKEQAFIGLSSQSLYPTAMVSPSGRIASSSPTGAFFIAAKSLICTNCGKKFEYYDDPMVYNVSASLVDKKVYCSFCAAPNFVK